MPDHSPNPLHAETLSLPENDPRLAPTITYLARQPDAPDIPSAGSPARRNWPTVPGYEILAELGRGGMGIVYKARQLALGRTVALKMILSGAQARPEELSRFRTEAEAIARLQHPDIVQIFEVGEHEGRPFFSLEFCPGGSLAQKLRGTPLPPEEAGWLVERLARAMHAAHQKNIVHRDLKPGNVLLAPPTDEGLPAGGRPSWGTPKVTDFGLAKELDVEAGQTSPGAVLGTPSYMAPEQASGQAREVSPAADVYSLGAILYECLTGRPPFRAATAVDTILQVLHDEPVSVRQLQPRAPRDLETVCAKCLQKEPHKRYASAEALAEDLQRFGAGEPVRARPVGWVERTWRWSRRHPAASSLLLSLFLATVVAIGLTVWALEERDRADVKAVEAAGHATRARDHARKEADQRRRAEKALAHALLARVRESGVTAHPGWTWKALDDLATAHKLQAGEADRVDYRSLIAECLSRPDLRQVAELAEGLDANALAFSKDGKRLALGERRHALACSVEVYDPATRKRTASYSFSTLATSLKNLQAGKGMYHDGVACLAFSPDGKWLVAGTRQGRLVRWDTTAAEPEAVVWQAHSDKDAVNSAAFSPDGKHLISASDRNTMRWDAAEQWKGTPIVATGAGQVGFSSDGSVLAVGGRQFFVGSPFQHRKTALDDLNSAALAFNPDGRLLALQRSNEIDLADVREGQVYRRLRIVLPAALLSGSSVQFSPDGALLVSAWTDQRLRLWDVGSGNLITELFIADRDVPIAAVSPDGRNLAVIANRRTLLYELRPADILTTLAHQAHPVQAIDFAPDGKVLVCATERMLEDRVVDGQLTFWDATSGALQRTRQVLLPPGDQGRFYPIRGAVAVHPHGSMVANVSSLLGAHVVPLGKLATFVPTLRYPDAQRPVEVPPRAFQFLGAGVEVREDKRALTGRAIRIPGNVAGTGVRFRIPEACLKAPVEAWSVVGVIRVERSGQAGPAFVSSTLAPMPLQSLREMPLFPITDEEYHLYLCEAIHVPKSAAHAWLDMTITVPGKAPSVQAIWVDRVFLIPCKRLGWPRNLKMPSPELLSFAPDGKRLWGLVNSDTIVSWQVPQLEVATQWKDVEGARLHGYKKTNCLCPGNQWLLAGTDTEVLLLAVASGQWVKSWPSSGGNVRAVALHPSETLAALGTQKGHVRVVRVPDGEVVAELPGHGQSVEAVVFSRDGQLLVTGGLDQQVRVWRKEGTGFQLLLSLRAPPGRIASVRLSADNARLAVLNAQEHAVRVWHLDRLRARLAALRLGW
jgi:WD40 repeat protein